MNRRNLVLTLVLGVSLAALGLVRGEAFTLAGLGSASLASGVVPVVSPPLVVSDVEWVTEFEGGQYRVRDLKVSYTFPADFTGRLNFQVTLTGAAPLPRSLNQQIDLALTAGPPDNPRVLTFGFDPFDIPVASVQGIHLMVCDHNSAAVAAVCRLP